MKKHHVFKNTYFDSVTLMRTSNDIKSSLNFNELVMLMATDMNKDMIKSVGLYHPDFDQAEANDLLVAADMNQPLDNWTEQIIDWLSQKNKKTSDQTKTFSTLNQAINQIDPNIAIVSVPGIYAAHEAFKALENNMHVMIFSDNVSIDDEIKLKDYAIHRTIESGFESKITNDDIIRTSSRIKSSVKKEDLIKIAKYEESIKN